MKIKNSSFALKLYRRFHDGDPKNICHLVLSNIFVLFLLSFLLIVSAAIAGGGIFLFSLFGLRAMANYGLSPVYNKISEQALFTSDLLLNDPLYFVVGFLAGVGGLVFLAAISCAAFFGMQLVFLSIGFLGKKLAAVVGRGFEKLSTLQDKYCSKIEIED